MDGWVWSNGGMILTEETEVLGEKHYTAWVVDGWINLVDGYFQWITECPIKDNNPVPMCSPKIPIYTGLLSNSPQPLHNSSSRRPATSYKHVTFGSVGHSMSATPNLPIQSTGYANHQFQDHARISHKAKSHTRHLTSDVTYTDRQAASQTVSTVDVTSDTSDLPLVL